MKPLEVVEEGGTSQGPSRHGHSNPGRVKRVHGRASTSDVLGRPQRSDAPKSSDIFLAQVVRENGRH